MADYDSSLPIRTESAGDVDIFISDATTSTQKLKVNADGSIDTNTTLPAGTKVIITDGTDDVAVNVDGSLNIAKNDLVFAEDTVDVSGSSVTVSATDLDIRDLVAATDSVQANLFDEAGVAFSATNPLPVVVSSEQDGDEVCEFNSSAAVAKDASVNHDYTVTAAKTFLAGSAWVSGSGKLKVEMLINGAIVFVGFNSTANPNIELPIDRFCKANATEVIRFTITNRDNQAQDLYSTLLGVEV